MDYGITDILTLLGSLGLFLFGMKVMSDALMEVAGDKMRNILAKMTSNRFFAVMTGFLITAVIQSSSATTLMVVSFVNASLLTLGEAIGVILGAHIGTTVTAWLITILGFKVSMGAIALPLIFVGFLLTFSKKITTQHWGKFIIGFALLFIGLDFLKDAVPDIKHNPQMLEWLQAYTDLGFWSVLIFLAIGTLLTVVVQSSSATMALTLIMCYEGWIPFDMAAAMVLGENIGTTITANLAALVANYNAKRAARAHFISQTMGVLGMVIFLYPFLRLIDNFTQTNSISAFDSPLAIPVALSAFHTSFNVLNTLVLIWFVPIIVKVVEKMVPYKEEEEVAVDAPKYLTNSAKQYPQTTIKALVDESKRLFGSPIYKIVAHVFNIHRSDIESDEKVKDVIKASREVVDIDVNEVYYNKVKNIYSEIIEYASYAQGKFNLTVDKTKAINNIKVANRKMVEIMNDCDALNKNMVLFIQSDNEKMQKAYDKMRKRITKVLRETNRVGHEKDPKRHLAKLEKLKVKALEEDVMSDGTLNKLLMEGSITSQMGSSLANDSYHVENIIKNLVDVTELLYVEEDTLLGDYKEEKTKKGKARKK